MSTLSDTVKNTRKFIIAFLVFALIVIIIQSISSSSNDTSSDSGTNNSPFLPSNSTPGQYGRLELTSLTLSGQTPPEFVKVGDFPTFPPVINVYKFDEPRVRLSSIEEAQKIAEQFKLNPNATKTNEFTYIWTNTSGFQMKFNAEDESIMLTSDLIEAAKNPISNLQNNEYIQNAINVTNSLNLTPKDSKDVVGRVDYLAIDANRNIVSVTSQTSASLVRVTLYKIFESATLRQGFSANSPGVPTSVESQVFRPNLLDGFITIIFNKQAQTLSEVVGLDFISYNNTKMVAPTTQITTTLSTNIYEALDLGQAFENLKIKAPGTFLVSLRKAGDNLFAPYSPVNVTKFNVDAAKTKTIYIEPTNWNHLDPNTDWDGHLYPFYWFEGKAILDNNDQLDFIFLVDAVPR